MKNTSARLPVRGSLVAAPLGLVAAITGCAAPVASQDFAVLARAEGELQAYRSDGTLRWAADVLDDPHEMVLSPDGTRAYVAGYGSGIVSEVDLGTGDVLRRIDLSRWGALHGIAISEAGDRIWVSAEEHESILVVMLETGELGGPAYDTGRARSHMVAADPSGSRLYAPDMLDGVVTVFDLATGASSDVQAGAGAEGIAVTPDGAEVWVSNNRANTITVIDARTLEPVAMLPSGGDTPVKLRITPDGTQAWVANNRSGEVAVFDVARREPLGTIAAGPRPLGIAFDEDGSRALISLAGAAQVLEVDVSDRRILRRVAVGGSPDGLAFIPAGASRAERSGDGSPDWVAGDPELVFPSADGAMIYADMHRSGRAGAPLLLMLHQGGAGARGEYGPLLSRLLEAGYDALAVDLRRGGDRFGGGNRTVAALGHNDTPYCDVYPDVTAAFARALELADGAPVIAWGSSYSGTLALRLAADHPDRVAAVLAFSPASGGPLADCPANEQAERLAGPALVVRPVQEAAIPSVQEQLEIFAAAGHQTYVTDPGTHGSSTLVPERIEGGGDVERAWARVLEFLRQAVAGATD